MSDEIVLRPAAEQDAAAIRKLIRDVGINPMELDWRRFVLAVDGSGRMRGCGQLKPHGRDIVELASIAVAESDRGRGVARMVIEHLLAKGPRPIYLTCRSGLKPFYEQWGFDVLKPEQMPAYYRRLSRLANTMLNFFERGEIMLVMELK